MANGLSQDNYYYLRVILITDVTHIASTKSQFVQQSGKFHTMMMFAERANKVELARGIASTIYNDM
ncbi:MAG: hypothetical protein DRR19_02260 [Candidatus Parabeggiatoa sp. nov. 1]|nr:MAG: hypothetical protein DRR19_02260 [Gammaproteobacteria bacterium]